MWAQLILNVGPKFAMEWAALIQKAKEGKAITPEDLEAATKKLEYRQIVTNTFLPPPA